MNFDEIDARMRVFETLNDHVVLPEIYIVARIDGRSFTRLTKELHAFDAPYDVRVRDMMVATTEHLLTCGMRVIYGYTQSDEISLLFHRDETAFGRKARKLQSILAGEASAKFSLLLGDLASFDCRLCELPNAERVRDYFRWRSEDAHRNALSAHCYWTLRKECKAAGEAAGALLHMSVADKNELLFQRGVNFNELPNWQKRGVGVCWESFEKMGENPKTGQPVVTVRRRIRKDYDLPKKDAYAALLDSFIAQATATAEAPASL